MMVAMKSFFADLSLFFEKRKAVALIVMNEDKKIAQTR